MNDLEFFEEFLRRIKGGEIELTPVSVREYLEEKRKELPWASTVLEYGKEFKSPSEKDARLVYENIVSFDFPKEECFSNSLKMGISCKKDLSINYVEGFTISPPNEKLIHAWNSSGDKVMDTTWNLFSHFTDYMGIEFPPEFVQDLFTTYFKKSGGDRSKGSILMFWDIYKDPVLEYLRARS